MVSLAFVQLPEFIITSWPFDMVTGIVINEFYIMFMQLLTDVSIITMQLTKIIGKIKA